MYISIYKIYTMYNYSWACLIIAPKYKKYKIEFNKVINF